MTRSCAWTAKTDTTLFGRAGTNAVPGLVAGREADSIGAMKITGVRVQLCHFPLPQPFSPSWMAGFPQASNGCAIYRVQTDEGIEGISASPLIADEAKGMVNLLRATLTGRDPTQVEDLFKILRSATRSLGLRSWH